MRARGADEEPDNAPGLRSVEPDEPVTRRDAGFAARARVEIDFESVLFARLRFCQWNEGRMPRGDCGNRAGGMSIRELGDGRLQTLLASEKLIQQREIFARCNHA